MKKPGFVHEHTAETVAVVFEYATEATVHSLVFEVQ